MAETIRSAVAQEAVGQVLSRLLETYEHSPDVKDRMDRMEMAHIRLEAAIEESQRWSVTSAPLLRWRSKLKRVAQECDHTPRRCRRRLQEEEEDRSSLPRWVARTAMSFVSSIIGRGGDEELGESAVRRFERFADGANEFLRYVELGGDTPRRGVFLDGALVRHLLEGKGTKNCIVRGGQHLSFVLQPFISPGRGMKTNMLFLLEDGNSPENNFLFILNLRLSESTNIVGSVVRCLELFTPHLSSTAESVKTKLTHLPTQDLHWVSNPHSVYGCHERGDNLDAIFSEWARPNPICCQQLDQSYGTQRYAASSSSALSGPLASDIFLEPVTHMYLMAGHVTLPAGNSRQQCTVINNEAKDSPYLKLGWNFWPHGSSEDLPPAVGGLATEKINGEAIQQRIYANISFEQLGEIMVPKAVDCLQGNGSATSYQVLWRSKHGRAYLQAEKTSWRSTTWKDRGVRQRKKKAQTIGNNEFMSSMWIEHAPVQLQASARDWIQKQRRLPLPLLWMTISCVHDCPITKLSLVGTLTRKIKSLSASNTLKT